jgi:hypothetical protein
MPAWMENYYIGEGIKNPAKIRSKIDQGKLVPGIYLVTLSDNPGNILEIIPAAQLLQRALLEICPEIIGMAKGKDAAIDLTVNILKEVYRQTGAFEVEDFIKNR